MLESFFISFYLISPGSLYLKLNCLAVINDYLIIACSDLNVFNFGFKINNFTADSPQTKVHGYDDIQYSTHVLILREGDMVSFYAELSEHVDIKLQG